jgi:hypothetical protein
MPTSTRALLFLVLSGWTAWNASAQSGKEFRTVEGEVRISAAPASIPVSEEFGVGPAAFSADSLSDLAALAGLDLREDPLFDVYFLDRLTGEELRFPVKLSHFKQFLAGHAAAYAQPTADARAVALIRDFTREMTVRMRAPGSGSSK